jgi:hypothetical protein
MTIDNEPRTHHAEFTICIFSGEIQRDSENVNIGERPCEASTPVFQVRPIYEVKFSFLRRLLNRLLTMPIEANADLRRDIRQ